MKTKKENAKVQQLYSRSRFLPLKKLVPFQFQKLELSFKKIYIWFSHQLAYIFPEAIKKQKNPSKIFNSILLLIFFKKCIKLKLQLALAALKKLQAFYKNWSSSSQKIYIWFHDLQRIYVSLQKTIGFIRKLEKFFENVHWKKNTQEI